MCLNSEVVHIPNSLIPMFSQNVSNKFAILGQVKVATTITTTTTVLLKGLSGVQPANDQLGSEMLRLS